MLITPVHKANASPSGIVKKYKFVLAFENSNCEDYVTEKIWHAYAAHAIPMYVDREAKAMIERLRWP